MASKRRPDPTVAPAPLPGQLPLFPHFEAVQGPTGGDPGESGSSWGSVDPDLNLRRRRRAESGSSRGSVEGELPPVPQRAPFLRPRWWEESTLRELRELQGQAGEEAPLTAVAGFLWWLGPVGDEARAAYVRARDAGMSHLRALVIGCVASFKDCWARRRKIAEHLRCSVRTVQRALTQAKELGLIGIGRSKPGEIPPGAKSEITCGFSHRWTIGWGMAGALVQEAVNRARAWRLQKAAVAASKVATRGSTVGPAHTTPPRKRRELQARPPRMSPEEIDAEVARRGSPATGQKPPTFDRCVSAFVRLGRGIRAEL